MLLHPFINHSVKITFAATGVFLAIGQKNKIDSKVVHCAITEDNPSLYEVELKNGNKIPLAIVNSIIFSFSALIKKEPITLYELVKKCKNGNHQLWVGAEPVLKDFALLDNHGKPHKRICDVLLSVIAGDGLDMSLGSPFKSNKAKP